MREQGTTELKQLKNELSLANKKYSEVLKYLDGGVIHVQYEFATKQFQTVFVSDGIIALSGYTREEYDTLMCGGNNWSVIYPDDIEPMRQNFISRMSGSLCENMYTYYRLLKKDGSIAWIQTRGSLIERTETEALFQCVITDITQLMETQEQLEREKMQVEAIASLSANVMFQYDIAADRLTCLLAEGVYFPIRVMEHYREFILRSDLLHPDDKELFRTFFETYRTTVGITKGVFRRKFSDGTYRYVQAECRTLADKAGVPYLTVGKYTDIDQKILQEQELLEESRKDRLTGLYQRSYFEELMTGDVARSDGVKAAFLLVDVDNFKEINDNYGHAFGDTVLVAVADCLKELGKERLILGRYGGDEFLALLPYEDEAEVLAFAQHVGSIFSEKYRHNKVFNAITLSIGVALLPEDGLQFQSVFSKADYALYRAKQHGKNRTQLFRPCAAEYEALAVKKGRFKNFIEEYESTHLNFSEELVEYLIEILGGVDDFSDAFFIIMEQVGKQFDLSYVTLRLFDAQYGSVLNNAWKKSEDLPSASTTYSYSKQQFQAYLASFHDGIYVCEDCTREYAANSEHSWGERTGIKATCQCLVYVKEEPVGVFGFSYRDYERRWTAKEIKMLRMISRVLSLYMSSRRNLHEIEEKMEKIITCDKITGLCTYDKFKRDAELLLQTDRVPMALALVYCDFTNFKHINDMYGYEAGDRLLYEFSQKIIRESAHFLMGAREYADNILILTRAESQEQLESSIQAICSSFVSEQNGKYPGMNLVISVGAYIIQDKDRNIVTAIDNANIARKQVKKRRTGGCLFFRKKMLEEIHQQNTILANYKKALENEEFCVYLQPQIDIRLGKAVGAEALVRWRTKDGTIIYPDSFIPVLEQNGGIIELDYYMLEHVLMLLRQWRDMGRQLVPISVNFSRLHFYSGNLLSVLQEKLRRYEISPEYIDLEITEGLFVEDYKQFVDDIKKIRDAGFSVSIDDFGTGYSSFSILNHLEVQAIKIDKSFLYDAERSEVRRNIIEYMVAFAKELGLGVVCEGAETEQHISLLKQVGCKVVQGYFYDRPLPAAIFADKYIETKKERK